MRTGIDRRELLGGAVSAAAAALWPWSVSAQSAKTRLILLGTGGGPRPRKTSSAPAQVVLINIVSHHTTAEDAGRVAQAAGVKTLVLSHFVPPEDPAVTDQMWIDAARTHFRGTVIVGTDLMEI